MSEALTSDVSSSIRLIASVHEFSFHPIPRKSLSVECLNALRNTRGKHQCDIRRPHISYVRRHPRQCRRAQSHIRGNLTAKFRRPELRTGYDKIPYDGAVRVARFDERSRVMGIFREIEQGVTRWGAGASLMGL